MDLKTDEIKRSLEKGKHTLLSKLYTKVSGKDAPPYEEPGSRDPPPPDEPDPERNGKASKKPTKKLIIAAAFVAIVVALAVLLPQAYRLLQGPVYTDISLVDMVTAVSLDGMNHYGEMTVAIDKDKLQAALFANAAEGQYSEEDMQAWTAGVLNCISIEAGKTSGLSNGDQVKVNVAFDGEHAQEYPAFRFSGGTASLTVSGLPDTELIDALSNKAIGLSVQGTSGSAEVYLDINLTGAYVYYLHYDWEPKKGISNGDTVTVSITPDEDRLAGLGYSAPDVLTREFNVAGLPEPVTDFHDIPDSMINSMVNYAEGDLARDFKALDLDDEDRVVVQPEITAIYFFDQANKTTPYTDWFSGLSMVNGVVVLGHFLVQDIEVQTVSTNDPENPIQVVENVVQTYGGYCAWVFPNVMLAQNGKYEYDMNMITKKPTSYQTESDFIAWAKSEFAGFSVVSMGSNNSGTVQPVSPGFAG